MNHWYIVKTKPKKEEEVNQILSKARYETFLPCIQGLCSPKVLFPSYLFVQTDLESNSPHYRLIRFTRGVSRFLGDMEGPHPVQESIIEALRLRTRDGSLIEQELLYRGGDTVRVKRGILRDLIGIVEKNIPATGRVKILFKWLSSNMRAAVKYTEIEKIA